MIRRVQGPVQGDAKIVGDEGLAKNAPPRHQHPDDRGSSGSRLHDGLWSRRAAFIITLSRAPATMSTPLRVGMRLRRGPKNEAELGVVSTAFMFRYSGPSSVPCLPANSAPLGHQVTES